MGRAGRIGQEDANHFGLRRQAQRDAALERATIHVTPDAIVRAKAPSPLRSVGAVQTRVRVVERERGDVRPPQAALTRRGAAGTGHRGLKPTATLMASLREARAEGG